MHNLIVETRQHTRSRSFHTVFPHSLITMRGHFRTIHTGRPSVLHHRPSEQRRQYRHHIVAIRRRHIPAPKRRRRRRWRSQRKWHCRHWCWNRRCWFDGHRRPQRCCEYGDIDTTRTDRAAAAAQSAHHYTADACQVSRKCGSNSDTWRRRQNTETTPTVGSTEHTQNAKNAQPNVCLMHNMLRQLDQICKNIGRPGGPLCVTCMRQYLPKTCTRGPIIRRQHEKERAHLKDNKCVAHTNHCTCTSMHPLGRCAC